MILRHLSPNFLAFDLRTPRLSRERSDNNRHIVKDNLRRASKL